MTELTALAIEKLKPGTSRREVPDGKQQGLYLVVQPSGAKSWAFRYRAAGAPKKLTIGGYPGIDLKEARKRAAQAYAKAQDLRDPAAEKKVEKAASKAKTIADRGLVEKVVDTFIERYAKPNTRPSSAREYRRVLDKEIVGRWRGRPLASITRADVHDMLDEIVDRGSPVQANRTLAAFRKFCGWAVDRGLIASSPCERVKPPTSEQSRDRVLSDDELKVIWQAAGTMGWPFGPMIRLLLLSGQRRDEVGQLRWSEIDLDAKRWVLPASRAKNGLEHVVPLSGPMLTILQSLPRISTCDLVFTTNGRAPVSGFSKAKLRIDKGIGELRDGQPIPEWIFHDLRRTCATGMARLGTSLPVVERLLNHISGSFKGVAGVYQKHQFAEEKATALEKWGGFVERLVA